MARAIVALVLPALFAAAAAEHSRSGVESTEVSLSQIRDTLRNLRRSIEDEEHDAENFYDLRQKWCDDTLHKLEEDLEATHTSLVHLGTDLKEHEAAVEEAEGTAEQIRADIALVQHTLNQTEMAFEGIPDGPQDAVKNTHRLLTALVQNKKQTLLSLQGELQVVLPTLAQMEARLAETQRRYVDRNESTTIHASFVGQLRTGCSDSAERADRKATARMSETSFIETALQALDQMAPNHHAREQRQESAPDSSPLDAMTGLSEVSFVQTSQETVTSEDDLIGGAGGGDGGGAVAGGDSASTRRRRAKRERHRALWEAVEAWMELVDPAFAYTGVALSYGFRGSPHVDTYDISYQWALSLGDFEGGCLCVESAADEVSVVDTHGKAAKVDGRYPHWVAPWSGERYSVIVYKTRGEPTARGVAVFPVDSDMAL